MISDALLREAAAEAEVCLLANLPEIQPHEFSTEFERKMKRLISRANHPIRHQVLRYAAAVLLAVLTLFGAVMAVSPEARAAVFGWVKNTFYAFVEYSSSGTGTQEKSDYCLTFLPDGYELVDVIEKTNKQIFLYADDSDHGLKFGYSYPPENGAGAIVLFVEGYREYSGFVHGMKADIYISDNENESNAIVWCDEETGALLQVHAFADLETLVELAENVEKMKK